MKYIDITTNRKLMCESLEIQFDDIFKPVENKNVNIPGFEIEDYMDKSVVRLHKEFDRRNALKAKCPECGAKIRSFNAFQGKNGDAICWSCKQKEINLAKLNNLNNEDIERLADVASPDASASELK